MVNSTQAAARTPINQVAIISHFQSLVRHVDWFIRVRLLIILRVKHFGNSLILNKYFCVLLKSDQHQVVSMQYRIDTYFENIYSCINNCDVFLLKNVRHLIENLERVSNGVQVLYTMKITNCDIKFLSKWALIYGDAHGGLVRCLPRYTRSPKLLRWNHCHWHIGGVAVSSARQCLKMYWKQLWIG